MSEDDKLSASATDWRSAALVIGELLADVGPHDYYAMNAEQWLVWALKAIERESLQAENARLTSEVARLREVAKPWLKASHVRLMVGEMTAGEMRSVQAVVLAIHRALNKPCS